MKELRDRIDSVQNTKKITEAMKLVAAAKVRRAQDAVVNGRPFAENLVKVRVSPTCAAVASGERAWDAYQSRHDHSTMTEARGCSVTRACEAKGVGAEAVARTV